MPFPVTCPACGKSFSISDDVYDQKIKGRVVSVKCKQCQAAIRLDGTKPAGAGSAPGHSVVSSAASTAAPLGAAAAQARPAAAPPSAPVAAPQPPSPGGAPATAKAAAPPRAAVPASAAARTAATAPNATASRPKAAVAVPRAALAEKASPPSPVQPQAALSPSAPTPAAQPAAGVHSQAAGAPQPRAAAPTLPVQAPTAEGPAAQATAKPLAEPLLFAVDSPGGDRELTEQQIATELAQGSVTADTLVWRDGMPEWLEVKKVPELARLLKRTEPLRTVTTQRAAAATAPAPGRFRPRLPTLPMGAVPGSPEAEAAAESAPAHVQAAEATATRSAPARNLGITHREIPLPQSAPAREQHAGQASAVPMDEEPTILRGPADIAALLQLPEAAAFEQSTARPTLPTPSPRDEETVPVPLSSAAARAARSGAMPGSGRGAIPDAQRTSEPEFRLPDLGSRPDHSRPDVGAPRPPQPSQPLMPPQPLATEGQPGRVQQRSVPTDTVRETPEARRAWNLEDPAIAQRPAGSPPAPASRPQAATPPSAYAQSTPSFELPAQPALGGPTLSPAAPVPARPPMASAPFSAPAPFPVSFPATADLEDVPFQRKRGKALWVVLIVLLLAAAGGAAFMLSRRSSVGLPAPSVVPQVEKQVSSVPTVSTGNADDATAAPTDADASAAAPVTSSGAAPGGQLPGAPGEASPSGAEVGGGSFAEQFAAAAKRGTGDRFDAKLARAALDRLASDAARCRQPSGPLGVSRVLVTFAPAGSVSSAVVNDAPLAGTPTATCIQSVLQKAAVPPFAGAPASVTHKITIQ